MNDQRAYGTSNSGSSSRFKRKDRQSIFQAKRQPPPTPPPPPPPRTGSATVTSATAGATKSKEEMTSSNRLLAGYMAYEYLTKGTVLGNKFDETAAKRSGNTTEKYKEITSLWMMNSESGVRIPNVVNPTQLARWIEM